MITLKNVKTLNGNVATETLQSRQTREIDCQKRLQMIPTFVDSDASLGPIQEMNAWVKKVGSYLNAGITTVFDTAPQRIPQIKEIKKQTADALKASNVPVHVNFYCDGNHPEDYDSLGKVKASAVGVKIAFNLAKLRDKNAHASLERLFQIAAQENMIVTVGLNQGLGNVAEQKRTAHDIVQRAIAVAQKYSAELCLQHVRTKDELKLIKAAKDAGILVYTEVAFGHLFASTKEFPNDLIIDNATLFLPTPEDQHALWNGINDNSIDLVGDLGRYAPPAVALPLMYEAYKDKKLTLDALIQVRRMGPEAIFRLQPNPDVVLIDTETKKTIPDNVIASYPLLSPWKGKQMAGWPVHVIAGGELFSC